MAFIHPSSHTLIFPNIRPFIPTSILSTINHITHPRNYTYVQPPTKHNFLPSNHISIQKQHPPRHQSIQPNIHSITHFPFISQGARASSFLMFRDHTQLTSRKDSSGRVISPSQTIIPDNTHHTQQTYIHVLGGIRTCKPSKRNAANQRLIPRDHWDLLWRMVYCETTKNSRSFVITVTCATNSLH